MYYTLVSYYVVDWCEILFLHQLRFIALMLKSHVWIEDTNQIQISLISLDLHAVTTTYIPVKQLEIMFIDAMRNISDWIPFISNGMNGMVGGRILETDNR